MSDKIAVVFDFDDTLAPDTTSTLLSRLGIDSERFWEETVNPLLEKDWDPGPAYLFSLVNLSFSGKCPAVTKSLLAETGKEIRTYPGVNRMLSDLQNQVHSFDPAISLEYYVVSSGIGEILRNTSLAPFFTALWASEFHYDEQERIITPKKIISFTDKTRYLFQITKGLYGPLARKNPFEVNKRVHEDKLRIPLCNFIYVGDGYTDIPCFSLLKKNGGAPIAVYDKSNKKKKERAWGFVRDERVLNLHSADYSENSDLCNTLEMAIQDILKNLHTHS
jgi:hypothetical protein